MKRPGHVELEGLDPLKPFYMAVSISYRDGSVAPDRGEGVEAATETLEDAAKALVELASDHPALEGGVYHFAYP